jgi:NAD(P)-dependent dehydrogenase (short-subunit alcohol dehydrogenase family)
MFDLTGKTALVTGSGQSVGLGIARVLADQGARVVINDIDAERAEAAASALAGEGLDVSAAPFDVTDTEAVKSAIESLGNIDILVNNAGNAGAIEMMQSRFHEMVPADWTPFVDVNLYGVMNCTHTVLPGMCERGFGRIITISSEAGRCGLGIGVSVYGAAKAAGINLMRHVSQEVGVHGVTANAIALGLMNNVPEEFTEPLVKTIPMGRLGSPEDAGHTAAFLASEEAGWITGQVLSVNGGAAAF